MPHSTLIMIYYSLFHSVMSSGIIFWGNLSHSQKIFKLQKRAIRITTGSRNKDSCRTLFKQLGVVPLKSQYIFSSSFISLKNMDHFTTNYDIHNIPTRRNKNFLLLSASLSIYQQGVHYSGVKLFNRLPIELIQIVEYHNKCKNALKVTCLHTVSIICMNYLLMNNV